MARRGITPSVVPPTSGSAAPRWGGSEDAAHPLRRVFQTRYHRGRAIFRKLIQAQHVASATDLNGTIEGRIGLVTGNGKIIPCTGANVYLLLKPLDIDAIKKKAAQKDGVYNPLVAHMVVEYLITNPETQRKLAYTKTKTNGKGQFVFPNLPGDRWYYVTAQALTGQVLVSWQIGVYLYPKERVQVFLHNANAALPIYTKP